MRELEQQYKQSAEQELKAAEEWRGYMKFCEEVYLKHIENANGYLELWSGLVAERSRVVLRVVK